MEGRGNRSHCKWLGGTGSLGLVGIRNKEGARRERSSASLNRLKRLSGCLKKHLNTPLASSDAKALGKGKGGENRKGFVLWFDRHHAGGALQGNQQEREASSRQGTGKQVRDKEIGVAAVALRTRRDGLCRGPIQ